MDFTSIGFAIAMDSILDGIERISLIVQVVVDSLADAKLALGRF